MPDFDEKDYAKLLRDYDDFNNEEKSEEDVTEDDENIEIETEATSDDKMDEMLMEEKVDNVQLTEIESEVKTSFLSYAMSVIVSRALPDVRDGLKPVQRRILYAMSTLGIYSNQQHKKSARIVGDVIGKYHPHGDSAVYEAMVRMAQPFSYRYPLVDGHGNFGSVDGDGAAAMRYTEARMSKLASEMLRDINKNTVDFQDNYDGTEQEPAVLPCRYPNILVNGTSGIAVGMATNIPPHNLNEVISGVLALIENPDITVDQLMQYIPAPDFPTGGIIMGLSNIKRAYLTGMGTVTVRAKHKLVALANGKKEIVITEIPYQVNKSKLIERIADLHKEKVIDGITDLRDESSRKGMRIVIEVRKDANVNVILNNLYRHSPLQTSYSVNMIALDKGQPKVMGLKRILECYLEHQIDVVTRRTQFDLEKAKARLHILQGLIIALANIDEVVETIKESNSPEIACDQLMKKFILTEIQAKAILDMRLQRLTGLEIEKIKSEAEQLEQLVAYLEEVLVNHDKKMSIIVAELSEIQKKYGDERLSEIDMSEDLDVEDEKLIPEEDVIITITNKGYIKRMNVDVYRAQKRGGKGITGAKMQTDDFIERTLFTSSHDNLLFFTSFGKVYLLKAYQIPSASKSAKGLPIVNLLKFEAEEELATVINVKSLEEEGYVVFATSKGNIKKTALIQYKNIRSTGIRAIILAPDDKLIAVARTNGMQDIIFGCSNGKAARFNESAVRPTNRAASGVKAMKLSDNERAVGLAIVSSNDDEIIVLTSKGYGKRTSAEAFLVKGRNGKGVKYMNITEKSGAPVCLASSTKDDDLIVVTDKGMIIRTHMSDISVIGRDTQGVKIIKLNEGHNVASIAVVPRSEDEEDLSPEEVAKLEEQEKLLHLEEELLDDHSISESDDNEDDVNGSEE